MGWIDPRYEAARRKYWTRHDAYRFAAPGMPGARMPGTQHPSAPIAALEEAKAQEAAEWEALQREVLEVRRDWDELKREIAARQLDRKWDGQPRDHGRHSFGKMPKLGSPLARLRLPTIPPLRAPVVAPAPKGLETQLLFYNALSDGNTSERRAVLEFNARGFQPGATPGEPAVHLGVLTRDQVSDACPRYWEIQSITNQAADLHSPGAYPNAQVRGTAIHTWVRDEINGSPTYPPSPPINSDFRSEVSVLKSEEARYGDPGSKRVDVYENPHTGTVCVYDIKTGEAGLSFARMRELANNVGKLYPATTQIVVTEVRPTR